MGRVKKDPINLFASYSVFRHNDPLAQVDANDICPGEFRDTSLSFSPAISFTECYITIQFRCTVKIVTGDTITIRLHGFKGVRGGVFALQDPGLFNNEMGFHNHFVAYYSGSTSPKGVPAQVIILKNRKEIPANTLVVLGVPEAVHIVLPEKVALNGTKYKLDGAIKHCEGGKIPRSPFAECSEVLSSKKRPVDSEMEELETILREYLETKVMKPADMLIVNEVSQSEVDHVLEAVYNRRTLSVGMEWEYESQLFHNYKEYCEPIMKTLRDTYMLENVIPLAVHKELARNFSVKVGVILTLEDALSTLHGAFYPELSRSALMVLRLYTMEVHDLSQLLNVYTSPCMHQEIHSAFRMQDDEMLKKWVNSIAVLSTCTSKLTNVLPERIPVLFAGVKELSNEELSHVQELKKGDWFVTNNFLKCFTNISITDEAFDVPDNAVLFEIHNAIDAVELGDCSQYPEDKAWLLNMMSSFIVRSVEVISDKNSLTKVVLKMRGALGSDVRDEKFPSEERSDSLKMFFKRAKAVAEMIAPRTVTITRCLYTNLLLMTKKLMLIDELMKSKYTQEFRETHLQTQAKKAIEEGLCRWLACTTEPMMEGTAMVKPAVWTVLDKKIATLVECCFLKRTKVLSRFVAEKMDIDFKNHMINYGKGPLGLRRVVGKVDSFPFNPR